MKEPDQPVISVFNIDFFGVILFLRDSQSEWSLLFREKEAAPAHLAPTTMTCPESNKSSIFSHSDAQFKLRQVISFTSTCLLSYYWLDHF